MNRKIYARANQVAVVLGLGEHLAESIIDKLLAGDFSLMDNLGVSITPESLGAYVEARNIPSSLLDYHDQRVAIACDYFMEKTAR